MSKIVSRTTILAALLVVLVALAVAPPRAAAAPRFGTIAASPAGAVAAYTKIEIGFEVLGSVATMMQWPYDTAPPNGIPAGVGISVDAIFTDPDGREFRQPAFRAEQFLTEVREGRDWHLPTGTFAWKVRFSPNRAGEWTFRLVATDRGGTAQSATSGFSVVPSSNRGFVRVSARDSRYFEFEDGSLFTGLGFALPPYLANPETAGTPVYERLRSAGVNFSRVWISSIFGSAWNTWIGGRDQYRGYLPVTGLLPYRDDTSGETTLAMLLQYGPSGDSGWFDACRMQLWWQDEAESIEPRTNYRIRVEYRGVAIEGPRNAGFGRYGLVAKLGEDGGWYPNCYEPGTATPVTSHGGTTTGFETIEGSWNSGDRNFLPRMHLALENVRQGYAFVRSVSLRKELGGGQLGPELMIQPSMQHQLYIPEEKALSLDKVIDLAERNGVYLKLVVMDKDDKVYAKMADDGSWVTAGPDNAAGFYGIGRAVNKTRWLQQMWWRYLQARWGYSPAVHSWELTNEGDPGSVRHYQLADEFGKFMHCRVFGVEPGAGDGARCGFKHPNAHLVTTSFWQYFPATEFWGNAKYPNVDYADVHAYVSTSFAPQAEREAMQWDSARYHLWHSETMGAAGTGKPVVRGEAGLDAPDRQDETVLGLTRDVTGEWLHDYLWAGVASGGLYELYWWNSHIWGEAYDHRDAYRGVQAFLGGVALNQGGYADWGGTVSNPALRVVGQKHAATGLMHLWVQNRAHTWTSVVDGVAVTPASGEVAVGGFTRGRRYVLERWDTYRAGGGVASTEEVTADNAGTVRIAIGGLRTDVALKLRPADAPVAPLAPQGLNVKQ